MLIVGLAGAADAGWATVPTPVKLSPIVSAIARILRFVLMLLMLISPSEKLV
jgi:hypothetical protein